MRTIRCDEVLKRSDYLNLNETDFEEQVIRFCISKLTEYEQSSLDVKLEDMIKYPEKKYEIFILTNNKNDKVFVLDKSLIHFDGDKDKQELFYSKYYASRICNNVKRLYEDSIMQNEDLVSEYKEEIDAINDENLNLRSLDENEYNNDRFIYNSFNQTSIVKDINEVSKNNNDLSKENEQLKEVIKSQENQIKDLTEKLKVSLDKIESDRKQLNVKSKSKFEVIINKIKEILN